MTYRYILSQLADSMPFASYRTLWRYWNFAMFHVEQLGLRVDSRPMFHVEHSRPVVGMRVRLLA